MTTAEAAVLGALRQLHKPIPDNATFCAACTTSWPCTTRRILDGGDDPVETTKLRDSVPPGALRELLEAYKNESAALNDRREPERYRRDAEELVARMGALLGALIEEEE